MIKLDILVRRRPDLTHEEFVAHWRDVHGPLFSRQPIVKDHVRRYLQSRTIETRPAEYLLSDVDGIAQIWFDDLDGVRALFSSQNYRDVIKPDEEQFTDPKRCEFVLSTEHTLIG